MPQACPEKPSPEGDVVVTQTTFNAKLAEIQTTVSGLTTEIASLKAQVESGVVSSDDISAVEAKADGVQSAINAATIDASIPTPAPTPEPGS